MTSALMNQSPDRRPTPLADTIPDACTLMGLSRSKVYLLIKTGEIPAFKIGRCTRILRSNIVAYLEKMSQGGQV